MIHLLFKPDDERNVRKRSFLNNLVLIDNYFFSTLIK